MLDRPNLKSNNQTSNSDRDNLIFNQYKHLSEVL